MTTAGLSLDVHTSHTCSYGIVLMIPTWMVVFSKKYMEEWQLQVMLKPAIMASWHSHGNLSPFSPGDSLHTLCQRLDETKGAEGVGGTESMS